MEWRRSELFPDYDVSEDGQVRRAVGGRGARVGTLKAAYIGKKRGYPTYTLRLNGRTKTVDAYKLVAWAFLGRRPFDGAEVAHEDGNRLNSHWRNLRWDTRAGNHADKHRHGTALIGEKHPQSKLTAETVVAMRAAYGEAGASFQTVADRFGATWVTARKVILGVTWAHLPGACEAKSRGRAGSWAHARSVQAARHAQA